MLQQIEDRLKEHHPPTNEFVSNRASVLIPLSMHRGEPSLLLTRRSTKLRSFSGHVSFPGGKRDQEDKSDYCTSLRESWEEVGLEQEQIRFVGELEQMLSPHGCLVSPFVARIPNQFEPKINEAEIESCFWVPISFFLDSKQHQLRQHHERRPHTHFTHHFYFNDYHIWGMTALMILRLLELASDTNQFIRYIIHEPHIGLWQLRIIERLLSTRRLHSFPKSHLPARIDRCRL